MGVTSIISNQIKIKNHLEVLSADLVANSGFENQTVNLAIEPCVALGLTICPMAPGYVTLQLLLLTIKQLFSSPLFILGPIRKN